MTVLIMFGSFSDKKIYEKIAKNLKRKKIKTEIKVLSAHRTPKEVETVVKKTKAKSIIAGAGLSAALPGVIASFSSKPVIGVPVSGNYSGLDAFLSVHQLPAGPAVLGTNVDDTFESVKFCEMIESKNFETITLIKKNGKLFENTMDKARQVFDKLKIQYIIQEKQTFDDSKTIYVDFLKLGSKVPNTKNNFVIFVPVKKNSKASDATKMIKMAKKGLWVGLNRGDNAALAALRVLGNAKALKALKKFKEEKRKEILRGK